MGRLTGYNQVGKKKILVADDEPSIRRAVRKILEKDHVVLEASDGEQAIDMARVQRPDLILMDIMMPKLDGVGACNIIKSDSTLKSIPVIMLTALTHKLDQEYSRSMGADGYLTKPFDTKELREAIGNFLKYPDQPAT